MKGFLPRSERSCVRIGLLLLACTTLSVSFDLWWHEVFGRTSFHIPPHILLYSFSALTILFSWYAWFRFKTIHWERLALLMFLLPFSAPFDDMWHRIFGPEGGVLVVWSPPHIVLALMFIAAWVFILKLVRRTETDAEARKLLSLFSLGLLSVNILFLLVPVSPFSHYHLLGPYGLILIIFLNVLFVVYAKRTFGFGAATLFSLFTLLPVLYAFAESSSPSLPFFPVWLKVTPVLLAALVLDSLPADRDVFMQALSYAFAYACALVGSLYLLQLGVENGLGRPVAFQYTALAISALVGGVVGGAVLKLSERRRSFFA